MNRQQKCRDRLCNRYLDNPACPGVRGVGDNGRKVVLGYDETMPWLRWGWLQLTRWLLWQPIQMAKYRMPMAYQGRTDRHQVVPGGVSVGQSPDVTAGTHGGVGKINGVRGSNSNWHVYVGLTGFKGNPVVHPGRVDGGQFPADHWADTEVFVPVSFTAPNQVDTAWAKPLDDARLADHFFESGPMPTTMIHFQADDPAMTDTRNGLFEGGRCAQTNWVGDIGYGGENVARFEKCFMFHGRQGEIKCIFPFFPEGLCVWLCNSGFTFLCSGGREVFGGPGASGSWIRREPHELGAQLFAGAAGAAPITIGCDVNISFPALNMEL